MSAAMVGFSGSWCAHRVPWDLRIPRFLASSPVLRSPGTSFLIMYLGGRGARVRHG